MSTLKTNNVQVGQSVTATNNFTLYQPATPDGTVRLGVGNSGATTSDVMTVSNAGTVTATTFSGSGASLTALNASNLASGTVPTARLATGTASSSTYLRGDQTWAALSNPIVAWVNFDGTTASPSTIRASSNVTSVTKVASGNYTVNFTSAISDTNYAFFCTGIGTSTVGWDQTTKSTTALGVNSRVGGSGTDVAQFSVSVFR